MPELLDVSAVLGLLAMVTLTLNVVMGILLSTAYKTHPWWRKLPARFREMKLLTLHNWTAYIALALVILHPLLLIADANTKFSLRHIFFPLAAPKQPVFVMLGSLAALAFIIVIITTQKVIKRAMGFRLWKNVHLVSYLTSLLFIIHGLIMDPLLKDRPTDWLDGEKLLCELCLLVLVLATAWRMRWQRRPYGVA